jgi:hypothetical protein
MIMSDLRIKLTPGPLNEGLDYEKAAFGLLEIEAGGELCTAYISTDSEGHRYHSGPHVSGYHLAEWLVWNWWRLRWEPGPAVLSNSSLDWRMAHCMTAIGEGYVWPNITFSSDGFQCNVISQRSVETAAPGYYAGAKAVTIPATDYEIGVDQFVTRILQLVSDAGLVDTNLHTLWYDLNAELNDPEIARYRRFEALLGFDPDEVDDERVEDCLKDAEFLGEQAWAEVATGAAGSIISARHITDATESLAFDMNTNDAFRPSLPVKSEWGSREAWRVGIDAANLVRDQAGLSHEPISDPHLAELAGISPKVLASDISTNSVSWVFLQTDDFARIALRSRRDTGRRFDVARLIGDRLFTGIARTHTELLSPATRSYSYRQKAQRAFAAELLSPWETVREMLGNDLSLENQEQVADHFAVSPMTIGTLLVNNERTGRE